MISKFPSSNRCQCFAQGYLDLNGRHRDRYDYAFELLKKFSQIQIDGSSAGAQIADASSRGDFWEVARLEEQYPDWTMHAEQRAIVHKELGTHIILIGFHWYTDLYSEQLRDLLARRPYPVFQRRSLSDMPVEILHMVAWHCDAHTARALSAVSRALHQVSKSYAWQVGHSPSVI